MFINTNLTFFVVYGNQMIVFSLDTLKTAVISRTKLFSHDKTYVHMKMY